MPVSFTGKLICIFYYTHFYAIYYLFFFSPVRLLYCTTHYCLAGWLAFVLGDSAYSSVCWCLKHSSPLLSGWVWALLCLQLVRILSIKTATLHHDRWISQSPPFFSITYAEAANAIGPPLMIIGILFAGFYIKIGSLPIVANWVPYFSLFRWTFEVRQTLALFILILIWNVDFSYFQCDRMQLIQRVYW